MRLDISKDDNPPKFFVNLRI